MNTQERLSVLATLSVEEDLIMDISDFSVIDIDKFTVRKKDDWISLQMSYCILLALSKM